MVVPLDLPPVVVHKHVVMSAQQDPVVNIRFAVISFPLFSVVSFCPRWRSLALGEPASTISGCKTDALSSSEVPLISSEIENAAV